MNVVPSNFAASYASPGRGNLMLAVVGQDLRRLYDAAPPPVTAEIAALLVRLDAPPAA